MSSARSSGQTPEVCDDYNSDDVDMVLIPSENYRFRVHAYRLQCFSTVFRSMISMPHSSAQEDSNILTHQWVDCSRIVKMALDIIYTLEVGHIYEKSARTYMYVVDFAVKWDIELIKKAIGKAIRTTLEKVHACPSLELMLLSSKLNDNALASLAFANKGDRWPRDRTSASSLVPLADTASFEGIGYPRLPLNYQSEEFPWFSGGQASYGGDIFDLGASRHQFFLQIPPTVVWIILKAQHLAAHDKRLVKYHFKELMDQAYPPASRGDSTKERKAESAPMDTHGSEEDEWE